VREQTEGQAASFGCGVCCPSSTHESLAGLPPCLEEEPQALAEPPARAAQRSAWHGMASTAGGGNHARAGGERDLRDRAGKKQQKVGSTAHPKG